MIIVRQQQLTLTMTVILTLHMALVLTKDGLCLGRIMVMQLMLHLIPITAGGLRIGVKAIRISSWIGTMMVI